MALDVGLGYKVGDGRERLNNCQWPTHHAENRKASLQMACKVLSSTHHILHFQKADGAMLYLHSKAVCVVNRIDRALLGSRGFPGCCYRANSSPSTSMDFTRGKIQVGVNYDDNPSMMFCRCILISVMWAGLWRNADSGVV